MPKTSVVKESITPYKETISLSKEDSAKKLENFRKEEIRPVKGIFQFFECPGQSATITFKKYKEHMFSQAMTYGKEYEIPLYVARFLNGIDITAEKIGGKINSCAYPINSHLMDADGNPIVSKTKMKRRFGFQSLEFAGNFGHIEENK